MTQDLAALIAQFRAIYPAKDQDQIWDGLSKKFHSFWYERVLASDHKAIGDEECDEIIRILDRNGKGNTKDSEAVAIAKPGSETNSR